MSIEIKIYCDVCGRSDLKAERKDGIRIVDHLTPIEFSFPLGSNKHICQDCWYNKIEPLKETD